MEQLRESVRATRAEYHDLSKAFDALLGETHNLDHGSPQMVETLRTANDLGPDVTDALHRYHDAVARLAEFYSKAVR